MVENLLTGRSIFKKAAMAVVGIVVVLYVHVFFDPLQVGVEKSSPFTWDRFRSIQKGQTINQVIVALGEPIRKPESLQIINQGSDGRHDPCFPRRCRTYRFLGKSNVRAFVAGYHEAIVIVGPDGRVVDTVEREE